MAVFVPNANFFKQFYTPSGQTGRWLKTQGKRTEHISKTIVRVDTGKLKRSIKTQKVVNDSPVDLMVEVGSQLPHAFVEHEGSPPHIITGKGGGALHWGGKRGPTVAYVLHPGTHGSYYLVLAMNGVVGGIRAT